MVNLPIPPNFLDFDDVDLFDVVDSPMAQSVRSLCLGVRAWYG